MDRHEAVLRELNMYPLWVRREQSVQAITEQSNSVRPDPSTGSGLKTGVEGQERVTAVSIQTSSVNTHSSLGSGLPTFGANSARTEKNNPAVTFSELNTANINWSELKSTVHSCQARKLRAGCTQTVFGVGDEKADWLFVGEGPGADEDAQGEPFVGQAGKLLDNMLMAIKLKRGNKVYIANVVKCRPPNNRVPEPDEVATCMPYLQQQIALIQPKVIVALGKTAANALLNNHATLGSLRGTLHHYQNIPLIVTYHPAYLLRSPSEKAKVWQDLCMAVELVQKQN